MLQAVPATLTIATESGGRMGEELPSGLRISFMLPPYIVMSSLHSFGESFQTRISISASFL